MPELPEVNRIAAGSSSVCGSGSAGGASAKPPKQEPKSATSSTGTSAGTAGSSVITATGSTSAIECSASRGLHHRLPNTGTAPTAQIANSATAQSGLL